MGAPRRVQKISKQHPNAFSKDKIIELYIDFAYNYLAVIIGKLLGSQL